MGAAQSVPPALAACQQQLAQLAGPEPLPADNTSFWNQLSSLPAPLAALNPADVEQAVLVHARQLLVHNPLTANFQRLVLYTLEQLTAEQPGGSSPHSLANLLHVLSILIKCVAAMASPAALEGLFLVPPSWAQTAPGYTSLAPTLIMRTMEVLVDCDGSDDRSYLLLLEASQLLLVASSTQLYSNSTAATPGAHPLLEVLMEQQQLAGPLVGALLRLVVARQPAPPGLGLYRAPEAAAAGGSTVGRMVQSAAATVLWLPRHTVRLLWRSSGGSNGTPCPLSDMALVLLLVMVHFPAHHAQLPNPIKTAVCELRDASLSAAVGGGEGEQEGAGQEPRAPLVSFARLYEFCAAGPANEAVTLLLYTLLHSSSSFLDYVLVRSDVETLLVPLLQQLYGASKARPNHLYMLQIILLILSQDTSFSHAIHKVALPGGAPWYRERLLGRLTLGSLVYIVLLRTAMQHIGGTSDVYLPTNTLAALANLAPQVTGLHSHAAQRLVGLASSLAKRLRRVEGVVVEGEAAGRPDGAKAAEAQVLSDFLRIILEVINCILATALPRNPELVYALLHKQDMLAGLGTAPRLGELVDNLLQVVQFFNTRLDAVKMAAEQQQQHLEQWDVARVLDLINSYAQAWRADKLRPFPDLRFVYEEEEAPEEFFVPYVWSLAVAATAHHTLAWDLSQLALLTPLMAVGVEGEAGGGGEGAQGAEALGENLSGQLSLVSTGSQG